MEKINGKPCIALVSKNFILMTGLKQILLDLIPFAEIDIFYSSADLLTTDSKQYYHFFITTSIYKEDSEFYNKNLIKTIILINSPKERDTFKQFKSINMLLPKENLIKELLYIQQSAHHGLMNYPSEVIKAFQNQDTLLSKREIEVLSLLAQGKINKEIADELKISTNTVITHRKNIMTKLHSQSLSKLVIYAVTHGYVSIKDIR